LQKLLLATNNQAKARELSALLASDVWELTTLAQQGIEIEISETGETLEANATIKARAYGELSNLTTIADDSGLEVEALGGEPGHLSARYAGEGASDREKIDYLLSRLSGVPWEKRRARFRCIIAVAFSGSKIELCPGECQGIITFDPQGEGGFGYDPVFYLPEFGKTMAEFDLRDKNKVSHRGMAARKARQLLVEHFTSEDRE